jgi:hypothetical protein
MRIVLTLNARYDGVAQHPERGALSVGECGHVRSFPSLGEVKSYG